MAGRDKQSFLALMGIVVSALLLFNLGVEAGQFAIVAVALGIGCFGARFAPKLTRPAAILTTYAIGCIAAYWVIERLAGYVV